MRFSKVFCMVENPRLDERNEWARYCSLESGHSGHHRAHRGHDLGEPFVDWEGERVVDVAAVPGGESNG